MTAAPRPMPLVKTRDGFTLLVCGRCRREGVFALTRIGGEFLGPCCGGVR